MTNRKSAARHALAAQKPLVVPTTLTLIMDGLMALVCYGGDLAHPFNKNVATVLIEDGRKVPRPYFSHIASIAIPMDIIHPDDLGYIHYITTDPNGNIFGLLVLDEEEIEIAPKVVPDKAPKLLGSHHGIKNIITMNRDVYPPNGVSIDPDSTNHLVGKISLGKGLLYQGDFGSNENVDYRYSFTTDPTTNSPITTPPTFYSNTLNYGWAVEYGTEVDVELTITKMVQPALPIPPLVLRLKLSANFTKNIIRLSNVPPSDLDVKDKDKQQHDEDFRLLYLAKPMEENSKLPIDGTPGREGRVPTIHPPGDENPRPLICPLARFNDSPNA